MRLVMYDFEMEEGEWISKEMIITKTGNGYLLSRGSHFSPFLVEAQAVSRSARISQVITETHGYWKQLRESKSDKLWVG